MSPHQMESSLPRFLKWCDKLSLANAGTRAQILLAAVKAQAHDSVLFLLCGRDYIHNPTDLKWQGIETLFLGPGTPYQINVGDGALGDILRALRNPALDVKTEIGTPHKIGAFTQGPGARAGGAGNYNLCTKTLVAAVEGLGLGFLNGVVTQVNETRTGARAPICAAARVNLYIQDMRNRARRFWVAELHQIGL